MTESQEIVNDGLLRMLVLGVGGGGVNTLSRLATSWPDGPALVAVDTDAQALAACSVPKKLPLGRGLTRGLSTGSDMNVGKLAAEESLDTLRELMSGRDLVCLVTSLGGGTGGGAAPRIAALAREEDAFTLAFATLPFEFEGPHRLRQAQTALEDLRAVCDIVVTLPNQALPEWTGEDVPLLDAFKSADLMVGLAVRSVWKLLSRAGIVNLDFADLRQVAEAGNGQCHFGYGEGAGEQKIAQTLKALQESPTLQRGALLKGSSAVLVNLVGGPDLKLADVRHVMTAVQAMASASAAVRMGAAIEESWQDHLAVVVLAADPSGQTPPARATASGNGSAKTDVASGTPSAPKVVQTDLNFEPVDKGRFRNVEPTIMEGEDLDIPTFIRRGIKLSQER